MKYKGTYQCSLALSFFMLNSTKHEISTAHKTKMPRNIDFIYFQIRIHPAFIIFEKDKVHALKFLYNLGA